MGRERPRRLEEGGFDLGLIGPPPNDDSVWEAWAAAFITLCRRIADDASGTPGVCGPASPATLASVIERLRELGSCEPAREPPIGSELEPRMPTAGMEPLPLLEAGAHIAVDDGKGLPMVRGKIESVTMHADAAGVYDVLLLLDRSHLRAAE